MHGGLTFSDLIDGEMIEEWYDLTEADKGMWIIGFDTVHYGDTLSNRPKKYVQKEADSLLAQVKNYKAH